MTAVSSPRRMQLITASASSRRIQADLDTPYPRLKSGGMSSGWTKYDIGQEPINGNGYKELSGVDGRLGRGHRRIREGGRQGVRKLSLIFAV